MYTQIVLEKVYSKCVESLKEYILQVAESGGLTHKQMEKLIIECRIDSFLGEIFLNKIDKVRIGCLDILQRNYNELCREEIRKLADCAYENDIKLIVLKGVVFSEQYYYRPEKRRSGDIDVFVAPEDFAKFVNICKQRGYRFEYGEEIDESTIKCYEGDFWRDQHFNVITKSINNTAINIDIHVALIQYQWFAGNCHLIYKDFWGRSSVSHMAPLNHVYELEVHDLIIYLGLHFLQHFYSQIWAGFIKGKYILGTYLNLLVDIASVLVARSSEIEWDYFCKLCNSYLIDYEMANVLTFTKQIFGEIVPQYVIFELDRQGKSYIKDRFYYSICRFMTKRDLAYLLINPVIYWLNDYVDAVIKGKETLYCKKNFDILSFKGQYCYGSHFVASKMDFKVLLKWNERSFCIEMGIKYAEQSFTDQSAWEGCFLSDRNFIVIGIHGFEHRDETLSVKAFNIFYKKFSSGVGFSCDNEAVKVIVVDDKIIVNVPWIILGFTPDPGKSLGLSIIWTHYDTETKYARVGLSGNPTWHDIMGMYRIGLSE